MCSARSPTTPPSPASSTSPPPSPPPTTRPDGGPTRPARPGAEPAPPPRPPAAARAGGRPDETRQAWRAAVDTTLQRVAGEDSERVVAVHGLQLPLGALLVVRAFELWTHENDVRAAVS